MPKKMVPQARGVLTEGMKIQLQKSLLAFHQTEALEAILKANSENETILHYACRQSDAELVAVLLQHKTYSQLLVDENFGRREFKKFVFKVSNAGETAFYQCLNRLDPKIEDQQLSKIIQMFMETDVIEDPNDYLNKRIGFRKTLLHLLVEREQYNLVKHFIYLYGDSFYNPLVFTIKDCFNRTPLMMAFENGNIKLIKLMFNLSKSHLNREEAANVKKFVNHLEKEQDDMKRAILHNKVILLTTDKIDCERHGIENYVVELDGRSFESLWLEYIVLAKKFQIPISRRDDEMLVSDFQKQLFVNRVNKKMSESFLLITLVVQTHGNPIFPQLNNFLKYLPHNFKIVLVSPAKEIKVDFYIKQTSIVVPDVDNVIPDDDDVVSDVDDEKVCEDFAATEFKKMAEYKTCDELATATRLFSRVVKDQSLSRVSSWSFYENLGDCYDFFCKNFDCSFENYNKAYKMVQEGDHFTELRLLIKLCCSLLRMEKYDSEYFSRAHDVCRLLLRNGTFRAQKVLVAEFYECYANHYNSKEDYAKELYFLKKARAIYSKVEDEKAKARVNTSFFVTCHTNFTGKEYKIRALEYAKKAHEYYIRSLVDDEQAMSFYNLGLAHSEFENDNDQQLAIDLYKSAIVKWKNFYQGEPHVDLASALNNVGIAYEELKQYENALAYENDSVDMYEAIYKSDHPDVALGLNNIGTCYNPTEPCKDTIKLNAMLSLETIVSANEMYIRLSTDPRHLRRNYKSDIAMTHYNVGAVYFDLEDYAEAMNYFKKARDIYKDLLNDKPREDQVLLGIQQCEKAINMF